MSIVMSSSSTQGALGSTQANCPPYQSYPSSAQDSQVHSPVSNSTERGKCESRELRRYGRLGNPCSTKGALHTRHTTWCERRTYAPPNITADIASCQESGAGVGERRMMRPPCLSFLVLSNSWDSVKWPDKPTSATALSKPSCVLRLAAPNRSCHRVHGTSLKHARQSSALEPALVS